MNEKFEFQIGQQASLTKTITSEDIETFAKISGDNNPIHLDEEYATQSFFKRRIAHGMLVAGLISAVLGRELPGPGAIYTNQEIQFASPVYAEDTITATIRILAWDSQTGRMVLETIVTNQNDIQVISGKAKIMMASYLKPE